MGGVKQNPLNDKDYKQLCKCQNELPDIIDDINQAIEARVPGAEEILRRCQIVCDRVNLLKNTYFGDRK